MLTFLTTVFLLSSQLATTPPIQSTLPIQYICLVPPDFVPNCPPEKPCWNSKKCRCGVWIDWKGQKVCAV
jgi:hypothetical protein